MVAFACVHNKMRRIIIMRKMKLAAAAVSILLLTACQAFGPKGIGATDCFSAGGVIDSSGESSMCKMQDGTTKPIL